MSRTNYKRIYKERECLSIVRSAQYRKIHALVGDDNLLLARRTFRKFFRKSSNLDLDDVDFGFFSLQLHRKKTFISNRITKICQFGSPLVDENTQYVLLKAGDSISFMVYFLKKTKKPIDVFIVLVDRYVYFDVKDEHMLLAMNAFHFKLQWNGNDFIVKLN